AVADTRRIFHLGRRVSGLRPSIRGGLWSSSVVREPQRTGGRLGSRPPCVLGLLGSRPRLETRGDETRLVPLPFGDSWIRRGVMRDVVLALSFLIALGAPAGPAVAGPVTPALHGEAGRLVDEVTDQLRTLGP